MMHLLAAAAVAVATPALPPSEPQRRSPAMFAVHDSDTTIFIFGSFHALDANFDWYGERIRNAFDQSNELVLETIIPREAAAPLPRQTFASRSLTASASFLGTTRMAIDAGRSRGMQVATGADMVLRDNAEALGKPVEALETLDSQIAMFARMPPPTAPVAPRAGEPVVENPEAVLPATMVALQAAWKRGDQHVFAAMLDQLSRTSPQTYRMMFVERNARWADWIAGRLQTPGVVFVAVGAGHLAGKDSLLVRLAEQGIESTRLN